MHEIMIVDDDTSYDALFAVFILFLLDIYNLFLKVVITITICRLLSVWAEKM